MTARSEAIVPVSWGSPRFNRRVAGAFEITDAFFPPEAALETHTHDRPVVAVTLSGDIESHLRGRVLTGRRDEVWTEPAGDAHSNRIGARGARVLVIQPDPLRDDLLASCRALLDGVHQFRHGGVAHLARCVVPELDAGDGLDVLMIEGLALQILATGSRRAAPRGRAGRWLDLALQVMHDRFREHLTIADIAAETGVEAGYFARAFKAETGVTVGRYVRRLRLDWAALQLRTTDEPIGAIALRARFADQSHFTREFKRYSGLTPLKYREALCFPTSPSSTER